jgi:hypothetical protein
VRPVIAAKILGLSEKTMRAWAAAGLLAARQGSPRMLLDVPSVHTISHVRRSFCYVDDDLIRDLPSSNWCSR